MITIRQTDEFTKWLKGLTDRRAAARIAKRLVNLSLGHFGDVQPVGEGVSELRIFYGPGYRLYLAQDGETIVILLNGGDKKSQQRDIALAKRLRQRELGD